MIPQPAPSAAPAWQPLASGDLACRLREAIDDIAAALRARGAGAGGTLSHGDPGIALFFLYRALAFDEPGDRALAIDLVERALERLATAPLVPELFGGWFGTGWVAEHVARLAGIEIELDELYAATRSAIAAGAWSGRYGLATGLIGAGVYARERGAAGRTGVIDTIAALAGLAQYRGDTVAWYTPAAQLADLPIVLEMAPEGCYDLSLSHGIPGAIAFLGHAALSGFSTARLLESAVDWLLAHALPPGQPSTFSRWWFPGPGVKFARNAWCIGDPGVASALVIAADALGDLARRERALAIARRAAARSLDDATGRVHDAGLCHGAAGLAHVFHRLYRRSGEPVFAEASRRWLARVLAMRQATRATGCEGIAGFRALVTPRWDATPELRDEPGLLAGAAGIGLAMLAAISDVEPAWDRLLLLS